MNTNSPVIPINVNSNQVQKQQSIPFSYTNEDPILSEFQLMFNNGHVTKMTAKIKVSDFTHKYWLIKMDKKANQICLSFVDSIYEINDKRPKPR